MSTPGIADPYWYEWYVGLENIVDMLNPDNNIDYVIFQHEQYDTIDDVVVGYHSGKLEFCYQVKHEISSSKSKALTFGKIIEKKEENSQCLFAAIAHGWKKAQESSSFKIVPILFTNRSMGKNRVPRTYNGTTYSTYPLCVFFETLKKNITLIQNTITVNSTNKDFLTQWDEVVDVLSISDHVTVFEFIQQIEFKYKQPSLREFEVTLVNKIINSFQCPESVAQELFAKLKAKLSHWTTTQGGNRKVTIEDVYSALGEYTLPDETQHNLLTPVPFFDSRHLFCENLIQTIFSTEKKVVFLTGEPGSGKTSIASYLHNNFNLFLIKYYTFKPIDPQQKFYNADEGVCTDKEFFSALLTQLRNQLKGRLSACNVPLLNSFCTVQVLRENVLRLLDILGKEALARDEKIVICVDGIDHAARSKKDPIFLKSLYSPDEIPNGVVFLIVGQPIEMYRDQYPAWLNESHEIKYVSIPALEIGDILQIVKQKMFHIQDGLEIISEKLFNKTKGNNLSTIFAVEGCKKQNSLDAVLKYLEESHISNNIILYYDNIWNFVKKKLKNIGVEGIYPESHIACTMILLNSSVSSQLLSDMGFLNLSASDWSSILNNLFPLIIPTEISGEYTLFHNDFRVYLMKSIQEYIPKYKEIAFQIADYHFHKKRDKLFYVRSIPLLHCAERTDLIPKYFNADFVIEALAEGVSKERLEEYAEESYDVAIEMKNFDVYFSTYLAIKTIAQHDAYYEYYNRCTHETDTYHIDKISYLEIKTCPLSLENLNNYLNSITLCEQLLSSDDLEHKKRGNQLYLKWYGDITPCDFAQFWDNPDERIIQYEQSSQCDMSKDIIGAWGKVQVYFGVPDFLAVTDEGSINSLIINHFRDAFYNRAIDLCLYELAISILKTGAIYESSFIKSMINFIYIKNIDNVFNEITFNTNNNNSCIQLVCHIILAIKNSENYSLNEAEIPIPSINSHYYSEGYEASFVIVIYSYLIGFSSSLEDDSIICGKSLQIISNIKQLDEESINVLRRMIRLATLLGKLQKSSTSIISSAFKNDLQWFLKGGFYRFFEHREACKFLLFSIINNNAVYRLKDEAGLNKLLEQTLLERHILLDFKMHILDFFKNHGDLSAIERYIEHEYGKNFTKIFNNEDFVAIHNLLQPYGELVFPKEMQSITDRIKWDVVGYTGHKEYILEAPLQYYVLLSDANPSLCQSYSKRFYLQSKRADISNNRLWLEINKSIIRNSIKNNISSFWEFILFDNKIFFNESILYYTAFQLIESSTTVDDLISSWILCCGMSSIYSLKSHNNINEAYNACVNKSKKIGFNFDEIIIQVTPEWLTACVNRPQSKIEDDFLELDSREEESRQYFFALCDNSSVTEVLSHIVSSGDHETYSQLCYLIGCIAKKGNISTSACSEILSALLAILNDKPYYFSSFKNEISFLLLNLGESAFWKFAEFLKCQSKEYGYGSSIKEISFLLHEFTPNSSESIQQMLEGELALQEKWTTGNKHIEITHDITPYKSVFEVPNSYLEVTFCILMENIRTQSSKYTHSAIPSIYALGNNFIEVHTLIQKYWACFSLFQKRILLLVIARWAWDGSNMSKEFIDFLVRIYMKSDDLFEKYYFHSIFMIFLKNNISIPNVGNIEYTATSIMYALQKNKGNYLKINDIFLDLTARFCGMPSMNDDIYDELMSVSQNECVASSLIQAGDAFLTNVSLYHAQILYGEEKNGRWHSVPLKLKKTWLLLADDPFMMTSLPLINYTIEDKTVFSNISNINAKEKIEHINLLLTEYNKETEFVLASTLWFLEKDEDKIIFCSPKIYNDFTISHKSIGNSLGCFGLSVLDEGNFELDYSGSKGSIDLFNIIKGKMFFQHGNCQLVPTRALKDIFKVTPSKKTPYIWHNLQGEVVLQLQRILFPQNESFRIRYYQQPVFFRWLCDKNWFENTLSENEYLFSHIYNVESIK